jgi:hypothetical protein
MASRFTLPHINITASVAVSDYSGRGSPGNPAVRIREEHGARIQNELNVALAAADQLRTTDERLEPATGAYIEVELRRGTPADSLDMKTQGIRAGAVKTANANRRTIALYVPDHARPAFEQILNEYLNGALLEDSQNPPNKTKVEAIEAIRTVRIATLWTDQNPIPDDTQTQMWWGLWCFRDREAAILDVCARLNLRVADSDRRLYFPEIVVVPVLTNRTTIELMMFATDAIAELRLGTDNPVFFTDDVRGEQQEWVDGLAERIIWPGTDAPAVCIFDTGVNRGHSLIEPALSTQDMHALKDEWDVDDHDAEGHGTAMAGMVLHGDLTAALADTEQRTLSHRVESVKFLPPDGFDANEPNSYGVLTQSAIVLPEFEAPERKRVYCMAITNDNVSGATASGWSAAIDQAASGWMIADDDRANGDIEGDGEQDEANIVRPKRLIVLSAGNIVSEIDYTRLRSQDEYPIEDPAQAWNALTVGGYTDLIDIQDEGYTDWSPMADAGELSPHSRTSVTWPQGLSPFKPELVMEAGNRAVNPGQTEMLTMGSLSLLTTGSDMGQPLVPFDATSAATAQVARMAAQLSAEHPDYWPETIRALMIHSAEWTDPMLAAFRDTPNKRNRYDLIRRFGYGVPSFERANASARNHLALIAQADIQPFRSQGGRNFNECHYYDLPIPASMLEQLENEPVELKVTLSYFIDPNPGLSANVDPQRYQSYGLRFDHQRRNESVARFKARVNAAEPASIPPVAREPADGKWMLGDDSISAGSVHCDVWQGRAIELLQRSMLCVKPVNGWWRKRASTEICNRQARYALVVTLRASNVELDIHTPIAAAAVRVPVEVKV